MTVITICVGARIGQTVAKGKELKLPNPVKVIREYKEEIEQQSEQEEFETNLANIDTYDGTDLGQRDFK